MQRHYIFYSLSLLNFYLLFAVLPSKASSIEHADSLFVQKKYTQAFNIYDSLYNDAGYQSEQMLLKMAFIKEGLNDYTNAIYYLNQYYELSYDEKTIDKISDLAEAHKLKGYKYDDLRFFESLFNRYKSEIMWIVLALAMLFASISLIKYFNNKKPSITSLVMVALLVICGLMINLLPDFRQNGILTENALIYSLPSSGSEVLETAEKGRRVRILDEMGVWKVIAYDEKQGYVKSNLVRKF